MRSRPGKAFDPAVMPAFNRLASAGASGIVQTGTVTTTAPCVYSLTTGRPGNLVQAIFNFHSSATRVDSLLSLMAADGGRLALAGDPAWHRQFSWLIPAEDRHEAPEPGITIEHHTDGYDRADVDFLLAKYQDPRYRLLILHLGSVDAVGHMVTPLASRYTEQLTFMDGLIARAAAAVDPTTTLLLVTGDHGMASRGTHGGEEEARLTPYAFVGPGVQAGIKQDLKQTALTSTLLGLLGLPFLPCRRSPRSRACSHARRKPRAALRHEYFESKRRAAATQGSHPALADGTPSDADVNRALNEVLFGAEESRVGWRMLAAGFTMLGVLGTAFMVWRSAPAARKHDPPRSRISCSRRSHPSSWRIAATSFIWMRSAFAFQSTSIAMTIVTGLLASVALVTGGVLVFSPSLLEPRGLADLRLSARPRRAERAARELALAQAAAVLRAPPARGGRLPRPVDRGAPQSGLAGGHRRDDLRPAARDRRLAAMAAPDARDRRRRAGAPQSPERPRRADRSRARRGRGGVRGRVPLARRSEHQHGERGSRALLRRRLDGRSD